MPTYQLGHGAPGANLLTNPSFEAGTSPIVVTYSQASGTKEGAIETGWAAHGTKSARFTGVANSALPEQGGYGHLVVLTFPYVRVIPGVSYVFSYSINQLDLGFPEAAVGCANRMLWLYEGFGHISVSDLWGPPSLGVVRHHQVATAPAGAHWMTPQIYSYISNSGTYDFYLDAMMIHQGKAMIPYGDGSVAGWGWAGTANASISVPTAALRSPALTLTGNGPYVLTDRQADIAEEQWVRGGQLIRV